MHPFDYVVHETERQSGTIREAVGMSYALQMFQNRWKLGRRMNDGLILTAFAVIKGYEAGAYRSVPAVFNQGTPAVPPGAQLEQAMKRWNAVINSSQAEVTKFETNLFDTPREIADFLTREFLLIHPFHDGNGRVGSLVWNFLNTTIMDPEPMPNFFGEN